MFFLRVTVFRPVFLTILWLAVYCSQLHAAERLQVTGETMGTYYAITIDAPSETDTEAGVQAEIVERLAEINAQMSTWDSESEISRFNQSEATDWFPVSAEFAAVVTEAKRIHELTDGAFDPTVSPLIDLWGFGKPDRSGSPGTAEIEKALQSVGMQHIDVQETPTALRKSQAAVQLNLSAIAKGYAVDALAKMLTKSGRPSFIVDIGGETRAGVAKANGDPWRIGVESPKAGLKRGEQPSQIVPITESSIATSGDYRNVLEVDGVIYSHTIDPVTGHPLKNPPASVSVNHDSCMTADALATALMVLGAEKGILLAQKERLAVLFQLLNSNGELSQTGTGLFEQNQKKKSSESWVVFVAAGVLFLVAVGGMAIGVLVSNRQIKGSCGGLASMPGSEGKSICELCTTPREECMNDELRQQMAASQFGNEASSDCSQDSLAI
jgi:thiamine biosynthesis lipoprotein